MVFLLLVLLYRQNMYFCKEQDCEEKKRDKGELKRDKAPKSRTVPPKSERLTPMGNLLTAISIFIDFTTSVAVIHLSISDKRYF